MKRSAPLFCLRSCLWFCLSLAEGFLHKLCGPRATEFVRTSVREVKYNLSFLPGFISLNLNNLVAVDQNKSVRFIDSIAYVKGLIRHNLEVPFWSILKPN